MSVFRGGLLKEYGVILNGIIIGNGHHIECEIRATKTTLDGFPSASPEFSEYRIVESALTAKLPDGVYEVLIGDERISLNREHGRFLARP